MKKKFELTDETIEFKGHILHRIRALSDFSIFVRKGDLGGFVEHEDNLEQVGKCWIYGNAKVYDEARVVGDCVVRDNAEIFNNACVGGYSIISNSARIYGNAHINDQAIVNGYAEVYGNAVVYNYGVVYEYAKICEGAQVYEYAEVGGRAKISGIAEISGSAHIIGNAIITSAEDYIVFKNNFSSGRYFTWTRSNNMWNVGCFYGTGKELIEKAYSDSEKKGKAYEAYVELVNKLCEIKKLSSTESCELITFPEIQHYMRCEGFLENCSLANSNEDIEQYGPSAYYVNSEWKRKTERIYNYNYGEYSKISK